VGGLISPPVGAAWKACQVAVDKIEQPTEDNIRKVVGPLFQAIKAMKDKIQEVRRKSRSRYLSLDGSRCRKTHSENLSPSH